MGPRLRGDDVLMCGHFAEESTMVPLSSRASVSEARDPHSAVSRYCCGVWVPAFAGTTCWRRHQHNKKRKHLGGALLLRILSIISRAAVIIGTIVAIVETLHRW